MLFFFGWKPNEKYHLTSFFSPFVRFLFFGSFSLQWKCFVMFMWEQKEREREWDEIKKEITTKSCERDEMLIELLTHSPTRPILYLSPVENGKIIEMYWRPRQTDLYEEDTQESCWLGAKATSIYLCVVCAWAWAALVCEREREWRRSRVNHFWLLSAHQSVEEEWREECWREKRRRNWKFSEEISLYNVQDVKGKQQKGWNR